MTMIKITTEAIPTTIKRRAGSMAKEKGMTEIREMVKPPRRQETPGMNLTLLTIRKMNIIYHWPSLLLFTRTRWEIGLLIVVPQGTSLVTKKLSLI